MDDFLKKIRRLNWVLSESTTGTLSYGDLSRILSEITEANFYILDNRGKVLGVAYNQENDTSIIPDEGGFEKVPLEHNMKFLEISETIANLKGDAVSEMLGDDYAQKDKLHTLIPCVCGGIRQGTILLTRYDQAFTDEEIALCEYGATVVGLEIQRNAQLEKAKETADDTAIGVAQEAVDAIDAIETDTQLKAELKNKLASIYGTRTVREKIIRMEKNKVTKQLMEAIEKRHRAVLHNYSSPSSNTQTDRLVEPFSLSDDSKHVWAFEISTGSNKLFKLSRIESVEVLSDVWRYGIRHRKGTTDAFRIISFDGTTLPARIRMNRRARNLLLEEYPLTEADITQTDTDEWTYDGQVSNYVGIGRFVIGLADCIKIETPELKQYVNHFAQAFLENL